MAEKQVNIKLVVIGGSSGSLEVIMKVLPALKTDFSLPILIIMHRTTAVDSALTELLASRTTLRVKEADEKDVLEPGCIYIAPPDYHLMVETDGTLSLDASEKVHFCRPSIDVSFISAAIACPNAIAGILLSGANADGASGIRQIKEAGGITLVQDPSEASVSYMPEQAILTKSVDTVLKAEDIGPWLNNLSG